MQYRYFLTLLLLGLSQIHKVSAQTKHCDETINRGDTLICRNYVGKRKYPTMEHFYVKGVYLFSRDWNAQKNGGYYWREQISSGAFAKANGQANAYYSDGTISATTFFSHGKKIGPCKEYYPSGALKQTCERHVNGKQDGLNCFYHENGVLKAKFYWDHGKLSKVLESKNKNGESLLREPFTNGNGELIWEEEGDTTKLLTYKNGKVIKSRSLKE